MTERQRLGLIWAQARGRVIGRAGTMPWHVPEDLAFFVAQTTGHPVIMGRRTWDSIPAAYRPFRGRTNIVISRQAGFAAEGAIVVATLEEALERAAEAPGGELTWIVGGGSVYEQALPLASLVWVTELDLTVDDGDTLAPALDETWTLASTDPAEGWHHSRTGVPYRFLRYSR